MTDHGMGSFSTGVASVTAAGIESQDVTKLGCSVEATGELAELSATFPGWNVWRSDEGCWWASRSRPLPPSRWPGGYALTVTANDPTGLREQLTRQPDQPGRQSCPGEARVFADD